MSGLSSKNTPTANPNKRRYQADVNVYLSQSVVPTNFAKYPKITVEGEKQNLKERLRRESFKTAKRI